ncbi:hypothetical protein MASR2M64_02030 [Candidatus Cloacimonadota bacterium]
MITHKRLDIKELLLASHGLFSMPCKKQLDFFCTSDIRDSSDEVPMLLGRD